ncbi:MAG: MarC family protein [Thermofilaceae archaeon]
MFSTLEDFWYSFAMLFVVLDSVGNIPLFYSITGKMSSEERAKAFTKSVIVASILLTVFAVAGYHVFSWYGSSFTDFKIAGGILLLLIALGETLGRIEAEQLRSEEIAVVPMATPLLAGPGSIYTVIYLNSTYGLLPTLVSIALNTGIAYAILLKSNLILEKAGRNTLLALARILAFLIAVFAVTMIRSGIEEIVISLLRS